MFHTQKFLALTIALFLLKPTEAEGLRTGPDWRLAQLFWKRGGGMIGTVMEATNGMPWTSLAVQM